MNLITIILLLSLTIASCTIAKNDHHHASGIYIDNGQGQTIPHRVSSLRQKRDMAREVMAVLSIPVPPSNRIKRGATNDTYELMTRANKAASRFIHELYQQSLAKDPTSSEFSSEDRRTISSSDIIVTYPAIMKPHKPQDLWFEITLDGKTHVNQKVIKAELHLYQKSIFSPTYQIHIYEFVKSSVENEKRRSRLVSAFEVNNSRKSGWIKLNVTEALQHWIGRPKKTQTLRLKLKGVDLELRDVICLDEAEKDKQPFLVGYYESKGMIVDSSSRSLPMIRTKRSSPDSLSNFFYGYQSSGTNKFGCRLHSMHVRFRELAYDSYIHAPDGYDAQFCAGQCVFPLNVHVNPTNHALVQALTRFLRPDLVKEYPCCAARELDDLTVLYSTDNVRFVLKKYPDMVVRSCGCQ